MHLSKGIRHKICGFNFKEGKCGGSGVIDVGALDLGEGRRLEGSLIGFLWGNNAIFLGVAPVIVGFLMTSFGYSTLFWYMAIMNAVGSLVALMLPAIGRHNASQQRPQA